MGWFSKKDKKEEEQTEQQPLKTEFPKYESSVQHQDLEALRKHREALNSQMPPLKRPPTFQQAYKPLPNNPIMPTQEKVLVRKDALPFPSREPVRPQPFPQHKPDIIKPRDIPVSREHPSTMRASLIDHGHVPQEKPMKQGKTIFVKLDQYEDAMEKVNTIMNHIETAEETIRKIETAREQELQELSTWKKELEDIKTRLKAVDTALFGR